MGERYGIPTELTSYLVQEPGIVSNKLGVRRGVIGGSMAPAAAPAAARDLVFESARTAAAQRQMTNVATLDSMSVAMKSASGNAVTVKQVAGHTMTLRDSVWTDAAYHQGMHSIVIKPYSSAYFSILERLPELRPVFAIGDRLVVAGRTRAIELRDDGASELDTAELAALVRDW